MVVLQLLLGVAGTGTLIRQANASSGGDFKIYNVRLSANKSSIVGNGADNVTITVSYYHYRCNNGTEVAMAEYCNPEYFGGVQGEVTGPIGTPSGGEYSIIVSGAGATASQSTVDAGTSDTFTVKGTSAGTATITVVDADSSDNYQLGEKNSVAVTVTAAPSPPPAVPPPTSPKPSSPPTSPPVTSQSAPESPKLTTTTAGGSAINTPDKGFEVFSNDDIVLSGTTIPISTVNIYVFSEEQHFTTTSDDKGQWTYTIARDSLHPGDHHVEIAVTDPQTQLTSPRSTVATFTVKQSGQTTVSHEAPAVNNDSIATLTWVVLAILAIAGIGAATSHILYRRHKKAHHIPLTP